MAHLNQDFFHCYRSLKADENPTIVSEKMVFRRFQYTTTNMANIYYPETFVESPADIVLKFTTESGPQEVTFGDFDSYFKTIIVFGIIYGARIGMSFIALPVTYLFTKRRSSPIFILNMICLFFLFIQSVLYAVTLTDQYNSLSYIYTDSYAMNRNNSNITAASNVFYLLLITFIEISQTYQVYIIFESPQSMLKWVCYGVTGLSAALGLATVALYLDYMIESNMALFSETKVLPHYLVNVPIILFITSTCLICAALLAKLLIAIQKRRSLGLKQFNLFHILFIMAFQTMVIPMILTLISFNGFGEDKYSSQALSSLGTALVAISLPMTTMWANSSISSSTPTSQANTFFFNGKTPSSSDNEGGKHLSTILVDVDLEKAIMRDDPDLEEEKFWKEVALYSNTPKSATDATTQELDGESLYHSSNGRESSHNSYIKTTVETTINN